MSSLKKSFQDNYTLVSNHIINDERLSLKAKGLYLYLVSKPDGWSFSADRIALQNKDGEDGVKATLKELEKMGLLSRVPRRIHGVIKGWDYILFDAVSPSGENPPMVKPSGEKPPKVKPSEENPLPLVIKENSNTDLGRREENKFILDFCAYMIHSSKSKIKNPLLYGSRIKQSLLNPTDKRHVSTNELFQSFIEFRPDLNKLPENIDLFDLYEQL